MEMVVILPTFLDGDVTRRHPRNSFQFQFTKKSGINSTVNSTSFVEPYIYSWNGTMEHLKMVIPGLVKEVVQIVDIVQN